jgi:hypothetical protein
MAGGTYHDSARIEGMRSRLAMLLLFAAAPAAAAVAPPVTVEALAREADAVVRGKVVRRESRWAADGRHIFTFATVRVGAVWRGSAPERVTVRVPGGEVGEIGQRVDAAPEIEDGEEVVLFLASEDGGTYRVHGLALGKFRVKGGEARPGLGNITFTKGLIPAGERRVETMPLDELEWRVRGRP